MVTTSTAFFPLVRAHPLDRAATFASEELRQSPPPAVSEDIVQHRH
jgi:hypothetical protein